MLIYRHRVHLIIKTPEGENFERQTDILCELVTYDYRNFHIFDILGPIFKEE